ncbi:phage portal protein [Candidatus Sumerlaeota bacterium]|nr:phage portal protein [Candidatus Sumerlaeota bacterium]
MDFRDAAPPEDPVKRAEYFEKYFRGRQYRGLTSFMNERDDQKNFIPTRNRAPNVRYNLCRAIPNRIVGFLFGAGTFPTFTTSAEGASAAIEWLRDYVMRARFPNALRKACVQGSAAVVFGFRRGKLKVRTYARTLAQPIFDDSDELLALVVKYRSTDPADGKPCLVRMTLDSEKELWERKDASATGDVWTQIDVVKHELGFVPAIWIRHLSDDSECADGESLLEDIPELQEEIDYSLSQRSRALRYSSDPQAVINDDVPADTVKTLAKSPAGTWLLGKNGKVTYLEIQGKGLEMQGQTVSELRKGALEIARVVLPDPDAVKGQQLSGFALRTLYEPMIDLADELKTPWQDAMIEFLTKVLLACAVLKNRGDIVRIPGIDDAISAITQPPASVQPMQKLFHPWLGSTAKDWKVPVYTKDVCPIAVTWGPYFDISPAEKQAMATAASTAKNSGIMSAKAAVRFIGPAMGVGDVDEEIALIENEQGLEG